MARVLREKIANRNGRCLVGPGVFDGISAHVANTVGFDWIYLAGSGASGSFCGEVRARLMFLGLQVLMSTCGWEARPVCDHRDGDGPGESCNGGLDWATNLRMISSDLAWSHGRRGLRRACYCGRRYRLRRPLEHRTDNRNVRIRWHRRVRPLRLPPRARLTEPVGPSQLPHRGPDVSEAVRAARGQGRRRHRDLHGADRGGRRREAEPGFPHHCTHGRAERDPVWRQGRGRARV